MNDMAGTKPGRHIPEINDVNREYFAAAAKSELRLQRCLECGSVRYPPAKTCPQCLSSRYSWEEMSGAGKIFSFVVYHRAFHPFYEDRLPYNVAIVELTEGPHVLANIRDASFDQLRVDADVTVTFEEIHPGVWIPQFKLLQRTKEVCSG